MHKIEDSLVRIADAPSLFRIRGLLSENFHAVITGREGGVSDGEAFSLNIAFNGTDRVDHVRENRRRIFRALSLSPERVFFQEQVHGEGIAVIEGPWEKGSSLEPFFRIKAVDAMITVEPEITLVARGADCQLISLFALDPPAVAVIHAGWRSTVLGLAAKTVRQMQSLTGNSVENIHAGFSPAAGPCCYEVGQEVADAVSDSDWVSSQLLHRPVDWLSGEKPGKYHFDLWQANVIQLEKSGIPVEQIFHPRVCTLCFHRDFYSYRKAGSHVGSHALLAWFTNN